MTRNEHLAWCKQRALEYVDDGDMTNAFASMLSDLGKHPDLSGARDLCAQLGGMLLMSGHLSTPHEMREWIDGFN
jgi:hypothetical protein